MTKPSVPDVLAARYASDAMATVWSPEHKVVLERRLWLAVLRAQRALGVDVPDGAVEAYEAVLDDVDLGSIAAREAVTRHDVKARIEEFCALAGHEQIHKGMTVARPDRERRAAAGPRLARAGPRQGWSRPWPGSPGWPSSTASW